MNKLLRNLVSLGIALCLTTATFGQGEKKDIASVVAAGKVDGDIYNNAYLGINLTALSAKFTAPSLVNVEGRRARAWSI